MSINDIVILLLKEDMDVKINYLKKKLIVHINYVEDMKNNIF